MCCRYGYVTPADLSTCAELLLRLGLDRGALDALSPPGSQSSQPQLDTSSQEPPSKRKKQVCEQLTVAVFLEGSTLGDNLSRN